VNHRLPKPYYDHAGITIYHADCREILPHLPKVDLVLTDPPYGIAHVSSYTCDTTTAQWMNSEIANDRDESLRDFVLASTDSDFAVFGTIKGTAPHGTLATLVWDKGPASGMGDLSIPFKLSFELIFIGGCGWTGTRDEGVIKGCWIVTRASMGRVHPNEKPELLLSYLLRKHSAWMILDPFMGSGTTLVAAKRLGRRAIGIEIEEEYCAIAVQRLAQEVLPLSAPEEPKPEQLSLGLEATA
jgi:16S rRNA G966 N2-methylase RsmD